MTYNEFKMCCILFCKTFNGTKYGEIVKDCYLGDADCIISINGIVFNEKWFGCFENRYLFSYIHSKHIIIIQLEEKQNIRFEYFEDFLNHFNIPLKDIIC